ncbi:1405_t:CDS:2 [Diversispora eburnea]|uniref:1405_t:CDS:1 n=1 Tax=Diversispora eburnea TaxID=1213867 RepID=A0A9N8WKR4_9GLOM|nr:1405_t:CDS:2 [Diversispora eburnea]
MCFKYQLQKKDLRPHWNDQVKEWSLKLWLPIMTDPADTHLTSSNICSYNTLQNSWFSSTNQAPPKHEL